MSSPSTMTRVARRNARRCSLSQTRASHPGETIDPPSAISGYKSRMLYTNGLRFNMRHKRAYDSFERRIGHRQHNIAVHEKCSRNAQRLRNSDNSEHAEPFAFADSR